MLRGLEAEEDALNHEFMCLNIEETLKIMGLGYNICHVVASSCHVMTTINYALLNLTCNVVVLHLPHRGTRFFPKNLIFDPSSPQLIFSRNRCYKP